jgi:hypothetical protein
MLQRSDKTEERGMGVQLILDPAYRKQEDEPTGVGYVMGREPNGGILFFHAGTVRQEG